MAKFKVSSGSSIYTIYDIALQIYGSIDGVADLLHNNPALSLCDDISADQELEYTDGNSIYTNTSVLKFFKENNITPSSGERKVYHKPASLPRMFDIVVKPPVREKLSFSISGTGKIDVDWGDNSNIESITLGTTITPYEHFFTGQQKSRVRFYGDSCVIAHLNISEMFPQNIYFLKKHEVDELVVKNADISLDFVPLLDKVTKINLTNTRTLDLTPLLSNTKLVNLDLTGAEIRTSVCDSFFINLVNKYSDTKKPATIKITTSSPSGVYQEPKRGTDSKYILSSGMEAIWVLTHEPAWNEGGEKWTIIINDKTYTYGTNN